MLWIWILVFLASLFALVKGAEWLLGSAEKIGLVIGMSPFIVGVLIVGLGTSFPELISAFVAVYAGVLDVPVANALGSNIANILLIVGVSAVVGRGLSVSKSLIDLDLPLLAISTFIFLGVVYDGTVTFVEGLILLVFYSVYLLYTLFHGKDKNIKTELLRLLPSRKKKESTPDIAFEVPRSKKIDTRDILFLIAGIVLLSIGAKYLVDSLISLSALTGIATGLITLVAVAFGTSLPELLVSVKAARKGDSSVALGNIFGSNVFNILVVVGLPALVSPLVVDQKTLSFGLPVLLIATFLFILSGTSRKVHAWEGILYIFLYLFFIGKLFGLL